MGKYDEFQYLWRQGCRDGEDDAETEIRVLPVVFRVIREFPEVRRAVEAAFQEAKGRSKKDEQAA